ncbi:MAG: response regulator, partial [Pirellulaceae bacterium]|nr:response regulator [Pirellulaceae bacterium]
MNQKPLRALVVDDSAIYRKVVRGVLESIPNVEVVGVAQNGKIALTKLARIPDIDLITLDIEMP